jgi:hypothetical protein
MQVFLQHLHDFCHVTVDAEPTEKRFEYGTESCETDKGRRHQGFYHSRHAVMWQILTQARHAADTPGIK